MAIDHWPIKIWWRKLRRIRSFFSHFIINYCSKCRIIGFASIAPFARIIAPWTSNFGRKVKEEWKNWKRKKGNKVRQSDYYFRCALCIILQYFCLLSMQMVSLVGEWNQKQITISNMNNFIFINVRILISLMACVFFLFFIFAFKYRSKTYEIELMW